MDFSSITFSFYLPCVLAFLLSNSLTISSYRFSSIVYFLQMIKYALCEISNYLNFSSQSYFTIVFKKITGTTPGNYRRIHKQHTW